ncbi:MAG: cysteine--tRNA ligase [Dehalococcoidia bacterium]|nr:cysteine--tRNA ligase [Dehalococcoidia bacterium]
MRLYNTLTRKQNDFQPADDTVKMYVCGPNLYAPCHVGHAMSYVIFDVLRRYLEYRGYKVRHVQNFTDIEDKIIARAESLGVTIDQLAERYTEQFFDDMDALNVQRAHVYPRATEEIPGMIEMIQGLIARGYAYEIDGDVYFRVTRDEDYGELSGRSLEDLQAGARIEVDERKEHPMDFALWKASKAGEPAWDSPWGPGRPGWHIECSVMSRKYLGETLDIHGGGQDLIFPHHENEKAQSESYAGKKPFVRFWVHNGLVRLSESEEKMTRSLGNLVPIADAVAEHGSDTLRLFILTSHYRNPLTYADEALNAARKGVERLRIAARTPSPDGAGDDIDAAPYRQRFIEAMDDDLNTAQALAALFALAREINRARDEGRPVAQAQATLLELAGVLGLRLEEEEGAIAAAPFIELLIEVRNDLREAQQWALADKIRSRLSDLGIALEDTREGTVWRRKK